VRLSLQTDYSLRTLMYLAVQSDRKTVADIAQFFQISQAHVAKVVNQLARLGYIRSIRGLGGGLELAREATEISVGDIIRAVEGPVHLLECVSIDDVCVIQRFCKLRSVLDRAERIQFDYLNSVRLSDVIPFGETTKRPIPTNGPGRKQPATTKSKTKPKRSKSKGDASDM
jgi:Rrf2 family nitric oxide-sensitive transcriptional repressor